MSESVHWTAEGKTDEQLRPRRIDGEWYVHVSDCHNALGERDVARSELAGAVERATIFETTLRAIAEFTEDATARSAARRALAQAVPGRQST